MSTEDPGMCAHHLDAAVVAERQASEGMAGSNILGKAG